MFYKTRLWNVEKFAGAFFAPELAELFELEVARAIAIALYKVVKDDRSDTPYFSILSINAVCATPFEGD